MSDAAWTAVAAIGAAALTAGASLGVVAYQQRRQSKDSMRQRLNAAVVEMLARSIGVLMRAGTMRTTMQIRSGLKEGLDVAVRVRKPMDAQELHDWMAQDWTPLTEAWSTIWTIGDEETIRRANNVATKCGEVIGVSTARSPLTSTSDRVRRWLVGEQWMPEMAAAHDSAIRSLGRARKELAEHARLRLGMSQADVFAQLVGDADDPPSET